MATQVTGELYESITGQLFTIGQQLHQLSGYPFDPHRLKVFLQLAVEGKFDVIDALAIKPEYRLLDHVGTVAVDAVERFAVSEKFHAGRDAQGGVNIHWIGFNTNILHKVEENVPAADLMLFVLRESSRDIPIIAELGGEEIKEVKLAQIWELLKRQARGESGVLLTNGFANIFYVRDVNGELWAVGVCWRSTTHGWLIDALTVDYPNVWFRGSLVISR